MVLARIVRFNIVVLLSVLYMWTQAEIFTTIGDKRLLKTQEEFIEYLEDYITKDPYKIYYFKRQLEIFKREHEKAKEDIFGYLDNPINVFTLIKRLTVDIHDIREIMRNGSDYIEDFDTLFENDKLVIPSEEDLIEAVRAIVRLQDTYELDVEDISDGNLSGTDYSSPMSAGDCFELGLRLFDDGDFRNAYSWIMEALLKYKKTTDVYLFTENDILIYVDALFEISRDIEELPEEQLPREIENYFSLCRGKNKISYINAKSLVCYYMTGNPPALLLAPIKVEQLHRATDVFLLHDMISDDEAEFLKNAAVKKLRRSLVQQGPKMRPDNSRVSKHRWLRDDHSEVVAAISRRVSVFTGLSVESAEPLQILNYDIAGYYEPHYDFSKGNENRNKSIGERLATVLIYLSDVAQGGATVFTELGLSVFPVKNAALFWMNLLPSGEGNLATMHAACPVLKGSKWVATKWIHEAGQTLQCSRRTTSHHREDLGYKIVLYKNSKLY